MSTDLKEWVVDRGNENGPTRYLEDHALRGDEDILMWTADPKQAWRLERKDAAIYAEVSYREATVVHETEMVSPSEGDPK